MTDFDVTTSQLRAAAAGPIADAAESMQQVAQAVTAAARPVETGRHFEGISEQVQRISQSLGEFVAELAQSAQRFSGSVRGIAEAYDATEERAADASRTFFQGR